MNKKQWSKGILPFYLLYFSIVLFIAILTYRYFLSANYETVHLYFYNPVEEIMQLEDRRLILDKESIDQRCQKILENLSIGPADVLLRKVWPARSQILNLTVNSGHLILNLSRDSLISLESEEAERIWISAVKASLKANVPQVTHLSLLIEGRKVDFLKKAYDWSQAIKL